ncbi:MULTISPECIES: HalOD1 output domain-containing protein [Haloarcula]|uniref:HalOD1 output domain-containing protein n=1 Tax=Haloarcula TaxID=2237 RepID=UPI0023E7A228|nr:HalOD1 output domain-containing protein [Halomicroarcula sp. SHR3]
MATATPPEDAAHKIVTRVAAIRDVEPTALPPLQETIDVDSLDALLDGQFSGTCAFTYADCEVRVGGHGRIRVSRRRLGDAPIDTAGQRRHRRRN